jgi:glyceraldehyde-3-phosphate dehydrogenase/erythrose-4-phosphate dehydrogenase
VSRNEVNNVYERASAESLRGILAVSNEPLVSIDYKKDPHSAIVDGLSTQTNGSMVRVLAWYDNEWAYATRLIDVLKRIGRPVLTPQIRSEKPALNNKTDAANLSRRSRRSLR